MADKEARVRLTLKAGDFTSEMRSVTTQVVAEGEKMAKALHAPMATGLKATRAGLTGLALDLKNIVKFGAGLGGALALGSAATVATGLEEKWQGIAFAVRAGTGEAVKWEDLQARAQATASQWAAKNTDVADSFREIYDETGDLKFTEAALASAAKASVATGKSVQEFSAIAGTAFEKFGVGTDDLDEALRTAYSLAERGGISFEEMGQALNVLGASAKVLGKSGVAGMSEILAIAQTADDALGRPREKLTAVIGLLEQLSDPDKAKAIGKALHIRLVDSRGNVRSDALDRVIEKTGGDPQKLAAAGITGATMKLLAGLGRTYQEGLEKTGSKSGGIEYLHQFLRDAGKSKVDQARWDKEAAEQTKDFSATMNTTMNELQNAFSKPEMVDAMKKLAHLMPKLAQVVAKMLDVVVNHPLLSGAGLLGGKIGLELGKDLGGSLASGLGKKIVAEVMAQKMTIVAKPIVDGLGMAIGKEFVTVAAAATPWQNAGKLAGAAMGVAIGAYLIEKFGEWIIDKSNEQKKDIQNTAAVGVAVSGTKDRAQIEPALVKARQALKVAEGEARSLSHMGMGMGAMGMAPGSGEVIETTEVKAARIAVKELEESLRALNRASKDASGSLDKVKRSAGDAASNGLPKPGGNDPGAG